VRRGRAAHHEVGADGNYPRSRLGALCPHALQQEFGRDGAEVVDRLAHGGQRRKGQPRREGDVVEADDRELGGLNGPGELASFPDACLGLDGRKGPRAALNRFNGGGRSS
jgi:hypothetical protein